MSHRLKKAQWSVLVTLMLVLFVPNLSGIDENEGFFSYFNDFPVVSSIILIDTIGFLAMTSYIIKKEFLETKLKKILKKNKPTAPIAPKAIYTSEPEKQMEPQKITPPVQIPEKLQKKNAPSKPVKPTGLKKLLKKKKPTERAVPNVVHNTKPIIHTKPQKTFSKKPVKLPTPAAIITHKTPKAIPTTPSAIHKVKPIKNSGQKKKIIAYKPAAFTLASVVLIAAGVVWSLWKKKPIKDSAATAVAFLRSVMKKKRQEKKQLTEHG